MTANLKGYSIRKDCMPANSAVCLPLKGSCHCGKVVVELLQPIEQLVIKEDNCSICTRVSSCLPVV